MCIKPSLSLRVRDAAASTHGLQCLLHGLALKEYVFKTNRKDIGAGEMVQMAVAHVEVYLYVYLYLCIFICIHTYTYLYLNTHTYSHNIQTYL
jgi:hypothetical protein